MFFAASSIAATADPTIPIACESLGPSGLPIARKVVRRTLRLSRFVISKFAVEANLTTFAGNWKSIRRHSSKIPM